MQRGFILKLFLFIAVLSGIVYYFRDEIEVKVSEINAVIFAKTPVNCPWEFLLAEDPKEQICRDFPSPCHVPSGWIKVEYCPSGGNNSAKYLCDGFAGQKCPVGFSCKHEKNNPDASGKCVRS